MSYIKTKARRGVSSYGGFGGDSDCKANASPMPGGICQCNQGFVLVGTDCVAAGAGGGCPGGSHSDPNMPGNCVPDACKANGVPGDCVDVGFCPGAHTPGLCKGGSNIQCCTSIPGLSDKGVMCPVNTQLNDRGGCNPYTPCGKNVDYYPEWDDCRCKSGYAWASPTSNDCVKVGGGSPPGPGPGAPPVPTPKPKVPVLPPVAPAPAPVNKSWMLLGVGAGALMLIAGAAALGGGKKKRYDSKGNPIPDTRVSGR